MFNTQISDRDQLVDGVLNIVYRYLSPSNFSYFWNFGSLALFCLVGQVVTGILTSMYYSADISLAFFSIQYIHRDVYYGWFLRFAHSNGSSLFFLMVYIHMSRGVYYGSYMYPRQMLWFSGVIIFLIMILTAFFGYVLPWGQMSFWAATVITSLITAIPVIGFDLVYVIWGGYSIDKATLYRFYSLHFFLPFLIVFLALLHVFLLHSHGSLNPIGVIFSSDGMFFYPYYFIKDLLGVVFVLYLYLFLITLVPDILGHADNYIKANALSTPVHIVPEWYFLPFYAVLRSLPDKAYGALLLILSILSLFFLPLNTKYDILSKSGSFKPPYKYFFGIFATNFIVLGWAGGQLVFSPYYDIGQFATFLHFFLVFFVTIIIKIFEFVVFISNSFITLSTNFDYYYKYKYIKS